MESFGLKHPDIHLAVPFLSVRDMTASLQFYVDGLGFNILHQWVPADHIEWCWLQRDGGALMLQEMSPDHPMVSERLGMGVSINFQCRDALALYQEFKEKSLPVTEPSVGNQMWVTQVIDPNGYRLYFGSETDVPEETRYSEWKAHQQP